MRYSDPSGYIWTNLFTLAEPVPMRSVSEIKNVNFRSCFTIRLLPFLLLLHAALVPTLWLRMPNSRSWAPWTLSVLLAGMSITLYVSLRRREHELAGLREVIDGYRLMARETSALVAQCLARDLKTRAAVADDHTEHHVCAETSELEHETECAIRCAVEGAECLTAAFCEFQPPDGGGEDSKGNIHAAMEQMLISIATPDCRLSRNGQQGFVLLLPRISVLRAGVLLERIRYRWQTMVFGLDAEAPFTVKASFAVAQWKEGMSAAAFLESGEKALEEARRGGGLVTIAKG